MRTLLALAVAAYGYAEVILAGPMDFEPIPHSAYQESTTDSAVLSSEPWILPGGYRQEIVSDESRLDLYVRNDRPYRTTGNAPGLHLYRIHRRYLPNSDDLLRDGRVGGALSVIDLATGQTRELIQRQDWEELGGLARTPWGSLLFAEETDVQHRPDPQYPEATRGLVYELRLDPNDPTVVAEVNARPALGALRHEGIETDAKGNIYLTNSYGEGYLYKFVPKKRGDLSRGKLYALRVENHARTGRAKWVLLSGKRAKIDAIEAARAARATPFGHPEDLQRIGKVLYVALKYEPKIADVNGPGAVMALTLGAKPKIRYFVKPGENVPAEDRANGVTGLFRPSDLALGPDGRLWIVEDNHPSDIWVASTQTDESGLSTKVRLFASLKDDGAVGNGLYFGPDPYTLYVNILDSATGNDKTVAIHDERPR
ncbi:MAG TPA: alkaline phosphatase PhoX [Methylococcus sp.]|nr:alkaline phosphatase PhoX [Methylococcus sp.]